MSGGAQQLLAHSAHHIAIQRPASMLRLSPRAVHQHVRAARIPATTARMAGSRRPPSRRLSSGAFRGQGQRRHPDPEGVDEKRGRQAARRRSAQASRAGNTSQQLLLGADLQWRGAGCSAPPDPAESAPWRSNRSGPDAGRLQAIKRPPSTEGIRGEIVTPITRMRETPGGERPWSRRCAGGGHGRCSRCGDSSSAQPRRGFCMETDRAL